MDDTNKRPSMLRILIIFAAFHQLRKEEGRPLRSRDGLNFGSKFLPFWVVLPYEGGTVKAPVEVPTPTTAFSTAATAADRSSPLI